TPTTLRSTLFPYTTLFRSQGSCMSIREQVKNSSSQLMLLYYQVSLLQIIVYSCYLTLENGIILKQEKALSAETSMDNLMLHFSRSEEHTSELQSRFDLVCR